MQGFSLPEYVRLIEGYPALWLFDRYVVIGDLHIGYEVSAKDKGLHLPLQFNRYISRLKELKDITEAQELIILGDVKDSVLMPSFDELNELLRVFEEISKIFRITIVQGNHDAYLDKILQKYASFSAATGLVISEKEAKVGLAHGHARPSDECLEADVLVLAHMHFYIKYNNTKYPVWLIGRRGRQTLILMPPFNDLLSGFYVEDVNAVVPFTDYPLYQMDVVTLDGYYLGKLKELRGVFEEND